VILNTAVFNVKDDSEVKVHVVSVSTCFATPYQTMDVAASD